MQVNETPTAMSGNPDQGEIESVPTEVGDIPIEMNGDSSFVKMVTDMSQKEIIENANTDKEGINSIDLTKNESMVANDGPKTNKIKV